jgi:hypothetical protein
MLTSDRVSGQSYFEAPPVACEPHVIKKRLNCRVFTFSFPHHSHFAIVLLWELLSRGLWRFG